MITWHVMPERRIVTLNICYIKKELREHESLENDQIKSLMELLIINSYKFINTWL